MHIASRKNGVLTSSVLIITLFHEGRLLTWACVTWAPKFPPLSIFDLFMPGRLMSTACTGPITLPQRG